MFRGAAELSGGRPSSSHVAYKRVTRAYSRMRTRNHTRGPRSADWLAAEAWFCGNGTGNARAENFNFLKEADSFRQSLLSPLPLFFLFPVFPARFRASPLPLPLSSLVRSRFGSRTDEEFLAAAARCVSNSLMSSIQGFDRRNWDAAALCARSAVCCGEVYRLTESAESALGRKIRAPGV